MMPKIVGVFFISGIHLWLRKPNDIFIEKFDETNFIKLFYKAIPIGISEVFTNYFCPLYLFKKLLFFFYQYLRLIKWEGRMTNIWDLHDASTTENENTY
jgi:hypothetical protein